MQTSSCYRLDVVSREAEQNNGDNPGSTSLCIAPVVSLCQCSWTSGFLLCVFYSKAGMLVKTLWSSSGQHADTSNISRATTILIAANSLRSCFQQTAPCWCTLDQCSSLISVHSDCFALNIQTGWCAGGRSCFLQLRHSDNRI